MGLLSQRQSLPRPPVASFLSKLLSASSAEEVWSQRALCSLMLPKSYDYPGQCGKVLELERRQICIAPRLVMPRGRNSAARLQVVCFGE